MLVKTDVLRETIDRLVTTGEAIGDGGERVHIDDFAIRAEAGRLLERAAAAAPSGETIEIGCASALSTLFIARGRKRSRSLGPRSMHVIDPKQTTHWKNIGRRAIRRAAIEHAVAFHEAPAHSVLPRLIEDGHRVSFVFCDGWHMLDYVMVEAFNCDRMLDVGGVLALHDLWMPALQHFACFWCANRPYEPVSVNRRGLVHKPCYSEDRGCGDPEMAPPYFSRHIEPYVDHSVLLLRKTGEDRRRWMDFTDYIQG